MLGAPEINRWLFGVLSMRGRSPPSGVHAHVRSSVRESVPYAAAVQRSQCSFSRRLKRSVFTLGTAILLAGCAKWNEPPRTDHVSGTIEVDETRIASRYGGRVEEILAGEGDSLTNGQHLIQLAAPELGPRRDQARAVLDELKAGARKEELAAAKSDWEAIVAELEFARAEQRRVTELFQERTVPEAERDRAVARVASLEKNVAAAKSRYELLLAGARPERIAHAEAQLAEIETQLREMTILSPTNAVLEVLHVKAGDVLAPNQPVATLLLTNHLWVRVYIPEPWLGFIQLRQAVRVRVDSFPERDFSGEVEQIARAAEFTPRNVQTVEDRVKQVFGVKIRLPADAPELRAGMAADVYFPNTPKNN
jgi:HlyD family secretion protein